MNLNDFFKASRDNSDEIAKILKQANESAATNDLSVESNIYAILELIGLFQKMEYWTKEAARLKERVNVLIDHKDAVKAELAASKVEKFLLQTNYDRLSEATKMLQVAFKSVNANLDKCQKERDELKNQGKK